MSSRTYRIAIIGAGAIGAMHARAIGDLDNAELVGASHLAKEAAEKFCNEFGGEAFDDVDAMLTAVKPDVATICTPSGAHLDAAEVCFKHKVNVLCEKPLEITTERIDQMIAGAKDAGVLLGGIFPQQFNPVVRAVYDAAQAGRFGDLAAVNTYVPWWRDDAYYGPGRWQGTMQFDGGGALMNQSIHGIDMLQWIAGAAIGHLDPAANPVEEVFAYCGNRAHAPDLIEVEDTAVVALRFRGGALGQIFGATSMFPGSLKRFQIGGRDGSAEILEDQLTLFQFRDEKPEDVKIRDEFGRETETGGGAADPMAIGYVNHTRNMAEYLQSLETGQPLRLDGYAARKPVAIIRAIYESASAGKPVTVD